jgi:uncharacterized protein (TIGR00290 family)
MAQASVLIAWSSGKDSAWTLHHLALDPSVHVAGLLTTFSRKERIVSIHGVPEELVDAQAAAAALPLKKVWIPSPCSNIEYERALGAALREAAGQGVTHLAFGDLFLADIRRYREQSLQNSGMSLLFPLWGRETGCLAKDMIDGGLRSVVTSVDTEQLDGTFAGRQFDDQFLAALPRAVDPCGERGEFHTFVYAGPMFARPLPIVLGPTRSEGRFRMTEISLEDNESHQPQRGRPAVGPGGISGR